MRDKIIEMEMAYRRLLEDKVYIITLALSYIVIRDNSKILLSLRLITHIKILRVLRKKLTI